MRFRGLELTPLIRRHMECTWSFVGVTMFFSEWLGEGLTYQTLISTAAAAAVASIVSDSVRPQRRQPTRLTLPWDSPGKNTGLGCHFLLQCAKAISGSEVAQSCLTLSDSMDCSLPGSSIHGIFQARVLEWDEKKFHERGAI